MRPLFNGWVAASPPPTHDEAVRSFNADMARVFEKLKRLTDGLAGVRRPALLSFGALTLRVDALHAGWGWPDFRLVWRGDGRRGFTARFLGFYLSLVVRRSPHGDRHSGARPGPEGAP